MQDRAAIIAHPTLKGTFLAIIADGMGGRSGGALAAQQVITTAEQVFKAFLPDDKPEEVLIQIVLEAHAVIKLLSISDEKEPHSTLVALLMTPTASHWIHVGDSRLYLLRGRTLLSETKDHSFVNLAMQQGLITAEQAETHPQRNMITSALGMNHVPTYDIAYCTQHYPGDAFILCSDGVWAYFDTAELAHISASMSARAASKLLLDLARERAFGQGDNLSLVLIQVLG